MDKSQYILGILENVLGKGKPSKNGDVDFMCPICQHKKPKLIINIRKNMYSCWTCFPPTKGRNIVNLLKKLKVKNSIINEMRGYLGQSKKDDLVTNEEFEPVILPTEFIPLSYPTSSLNLRHALAYLNRRGVTQSDIIKYGIGYCDTGRYRGRVIIPSYDSDNRLQYFIGRAISDTTLKKFDAPKCKKSDVVGFENMINFDAPITICEGVFDAITIKRNVIPLFGKTISSAVMKKLVESRVKTIYIVLDSDAIRESIDSAKKLISYDKEVYLIELNGMDPNELGFENMINLLHNAKPLTYEDLFKLKMNTAFK